MIRGFSRRGQPLLALVLLLGGWVSARAMMFDPAALPPPLLRERPAAALAAPDEAVRTPGTAQMTPLPEESPPWAEAQTQPSPDTVSPDAETAAPPLHRARGAPASAPALPLHEPASRAPAQRFAPPPPAPAFAPVPTRIAAGHQLLWMAALARVPVPMDLLAMQPGGAALAPFYPGLGEAPGRSSAGQPFSPRSARRWSADGWVLWRRGGQAGLSGGLLTPSYGASQAGAVLRYRLAPDSALRPAVYLRATAALNGSREREAALGLSLRPFPQVPLSLHGEGRFTHAPGTRMVRPAAFAVTELPPFALPLGLRGEVYGQAGYVGGKFATAFADGQLRVDRGLFKLGGAEMRLGGGVWGGAQKGASRVDAGPALTLGKPLGGPASMRLAADWRFRVAGTAAPGSGPAVTLSAGF